METEHALSARRSSAFSLAGLPEPDLGPVSGSSRVHLGTQRPLCQLLYVTGRGDAPGGTAAYRRSTNQSRNRPVKVLKPQVGLQVGLAGLEPATGRL